MMKITDKRVGDEQGDFWKGRGCVDQIFTLKILVEKYLEFEKTYDNHELTGRAYGILKSVWQGWATFSTGSANLSLTQKNFATACQYFFFFLTQ